MHGYELVVRHDSLGGDTPKLETLFVLSEDETAAVTLVRTALRLTDETVHVVRTLSDAEWRAKGLKPFQVKHG
jgi:hypothetical protein